MILAGLFFISNLVALVPNTFWMATVGTCGAFKGIKPQAALMRYVKLTSSRSETFKKSAENVIVWGFSSTTLICVVMFLVVEIYFLRARMDRYAKQCSVLTREKKKTSRFMKDKLAKMYEEAKEQGCDLSEHMLEDRSAKDKLRDALVFMSVLKGVHDENSVETHTQKTDRRRRELAAESPEARPPIGWGEGGGHEPALPATS